MDAFETIAARFFEVQGYWTRVGVKVEITKPEKVAVNNTSMPRPEIDVVAWKPSTNRFLVIECKSYLDSTGVRLEHLHGQEDVENDKFKLFNRAALRGLIVTALVRHFRAEGSLPGQILPCSSSSSRARSTRITRRRCAHDARSAGGGSSPLRVGSGCPQVRETWV